MRKQLALIAALMVGFAGQQAFAQSNNSCPSPEALVAEFGDGAGEMTRCIERRHNVKVVVQLNQDCSDLACTKAYGLGNIENLIKDYKNNYGMVAGKDFEIVAVIHGHGGSLVLNDTTKNPFAENTYDSNGNLKALGIKGLMAEGVKFYFCQNTARSMVKSLKFDPSKGSVTDQMIDGIQFTTSGVAGLVDFQKLGYVMLQP